METDALPAVQPTESKYGRHKRTEKWTT